MQSECAGRIFPGKFLSSYRIKVADPPVQKRHVSFECGILYDRFVFFVQNAYFFKKNEKIIIKIHKKTQFYVIIHRYSKSSVGTKTDGGAWSHAGIGLYSVGEDVHHGAGKLCGRGQKAQVSLRIGCRGTVTGYE